MEQIIGYAVKTVVCSGAFYLLYRLLFDQKTSYAFCRAYLVTALIVSALIPALRFAVWPGEVIEIPLELVAIMNDAQSAAPVPVPAPVPETSGLTTVSYLLLFYGAVSLFFTFAIAAQFVRIRNYCRRSVRIKLEGAAVYESSEVKTPFTFFRSVFIPSGLPDAEREQIIAHEISHARHNHSAELLAIEMMKALMWFNPFLWLSRKALVEVHEYEADNAVIENGHDVHDYKNLLFRQLFGYSPDISNGLAASKTKKRFIMIDKKKPGRRSVLRAAAVLPVLTALVMLFCFTDKAASIVYTDPESPEQTVRQKETQPLIIIRDIPEDRELPELKIVQDGGLPEPDIHEIWDLPGLTAGKSTNHDGTPTNGKKIAVFLNGTEVDMEYFGIIRMNGASLTIISDKETLESYGKGDHDHIFLITNDNPVAGPALNVGAGNVFSGADNAVLYIDGVESNKRFSDIDPDQIEHITVLKDGAALEAYGKPSVILVTTKAAPEEDEEEPFIVVENMPQFDGDDSLLKFRQWINDALMDDEIFSNLKMNGRYIISFIINKEGRLTKATVVKSPDPLYNENMIRIFESSPLWTPGTQRGQKVNVKMNIPVEFKIM